MPYQRLWLYYGTPLVAFYDTLGIRRMYSRLIPPASSQEGGGLKVLPQEIHMCNMKALCHLVQKLWQRLSFYSKLFKDKVTRSKCLVPTEKSCHKEYKCEI